MPSEHGKHRVWIGIAISGVAFAALAVWVVFSRLEEAPKPREPVARPEQPPSAASTPAGLTAAPAASPANEANPRRDRTVPRTASEAPLPAGDALSASAAGNHDAERAEAARDLEHVDVMLRDFRTVVGENPVGTNAEIMRAIDGANVKQLKLGAPAGHQLSPSGELVDRWGTPYFFHQLSGTQMEIRSAGPDRTLWTRDDVSIGGATARAEE